MLPVRLLALGRRAPAGGSPSGCRASSGSLSCAASGRVGRVRIATWNVNSLNARLPRVEEWVAQVQPDVLCMQETKLADDAFPALAFQALGYESAHHGSGRWNGVAILSRVGIDRRRRRVRGRRRRARPRCPPAVGHLRWRAGGQRLRAQRAGARPTTTTSTSCRGWPDSAPCSTRTPTSRSPLAVVRRLQHRPRRPRRVGSGRLRGRDPRERARARRRLHALEDWGLVDVFRRHYDAAGLFSWWDYRAGNFHKGKGMRIDLVLATPTLGRALHQRAHRPQRPQGQAAERPRAGDRRLRPVTPPWRRRDPAGRP